MKRFILVLAVLLLVLCAYACALAADVRPLETADDVIDLKNGNFCLGVSDADRITDGGYFTAALYVEDLYDAKQVEALAPGDTILVNGKTLTVWEVKVHPADDTDPEDSYEVYTAEEYDGYIVFIRESADAFFCRTNDWIPVTPVGDVRVMLPLPDRFAYFSGEEEGARGQDAFLDDLEEYGDTFNPYNTFCAFEDGMLVRVTHFSYPEGPAAEPDEDIEAVEADLSAAEDGAVPVWQFCHGVRDGLETAVITGYSIDCEAGPSPVEMSPEEIEDIRLLAVSGVVTDKANDESVTGGTWVYSFETPEGEHLLSIEMYKGLIVAVDGMYHYHR